MARQMITTMTDDLDGTTPADTTIEFTIDGVQYEIDLSAKNAEKMRKELAVWVSHARRVSTRVNRRKSASAIAVRKQELAPVREWAEANGIKVSQKGRISGEVMAAFWNRDKAKDTTSTAAKAKARRVEKAVEKSAALTVPDAPQFSSQQ